MKFDAVVIGGGIFGCYAALYLAGQGRRVCLLEKEAHLFKKASLVNQARLHGGYHYPRSMGTALMSDEHKARFTADHRPFVNTSFEKYYAIDRYGSFTDALQFERFCERVHIKCERVVAHPLFNFNRLEALYLTEEYSFDPVLLGEYYKKRVGDETGITTHLSANLLAAGSSGSEWDLLLDLNGGGAPVTISAALVINATYAATNVVNRIFGLNDLQLTHEVSEIAYITSAQLGNRGITIMDGPFGSIMPYGKSGLLSLSSVAYTHHKISYDPLPRFNCQQPDDPYCTPEKPGICTDCNNRPLSNAHKMMGQMQLYFSDQVELQYWFSYFTIKSKLKASHIDDSRPTEIALLHDRPKFYCLFAGKINSIYEVEKVV